MLHLSQYLHIESSIVVVFKDDLCLIFGELMWQPCKQLEQNKAHRETDCMGSGTPDIAYISGLEIQTFSNYQCGE